MTTYTFSSNMQGPQGDEVWWCPECHATYAPGWIHSRWNFAAHRLEKCPGEPIDLVAFWRTHQGQAEIERGTSP